MMKKTLKGAQASLAKYNCDDLRLRGLSRDGRPDVDSWKEIKQRTFNKYCKQDKEYLAARVKQLQAASETLSKSFTKPAAGFPDA